MGKKDQNLYDLKGFFDKNIRPMADSLAEKCRENNIPLFISAAVYNMDDETVYEDITVNTQSAHGELTDFVVSDENGFTIYDKTKFYETECEPIAIKIAQQCAIHSLPIYIAAAVKNENKETKYNVKAFLTGSSNVVLFDDRIKWYLMIAGGGCKAVPKRYNQDLDTTDLFDDIYEVDDFDL